MIPDRLQYFLDDSWNFQKINQIWTLGPRSYHKISSKIQENMGSSWNILFPYLRIWNSDCVGRSVYLTFCNFGIWIFENLKTRKLQNKAWNSMFEIWTFGHRKCEIWKIELNKWQIWKFENVRVAVWGCLSVHVSRGLKNGKGHKHRSFRILW